MTRLWYGNHNLIAPIPTQKAFSNLVAHCKADMIISDFPEGLPLPVDRQIFAYLPGAFEGVISSNRKR
jgi:hypothetical protein